MATTTQISPNVCTYPIDVEPERLHIEVELPGVRKEDIKFKLLEDKFYIRATKGDIEYVGTYEVPNSVIPKEAKATFNDGLLVVEVPYKDVFNEGVEVPVE